jgi:hypothetical protein
VPALTRRTHQAGKGKKGKGKGNQLKGKGKGGGVKGMFWTRA